MASVGRGRPESAELSRTLGEALAGERRRLSREIHDVIAHSVSVMVLQAAGARRVLRHDPERAGEAMLQIEQVGRQSMAELARLLTVLRASGAVDADADADRWDPQPGLADLESLLEAFRGDGLDVRLERAGTPGRLDGSVGACALRIVGEGLENVVRHAGPRATAVVGLRWAADQLGIEVTDDGAGAPRPGGDAGPGAASGPAASSGTGLARMRERAAAVGGRLESGPLPGGGFLLSVTLPAARAAAAGPGTGVREANRSPE